MIDIDKVIAEAKRFVFGQDDALSRLVTTLALMERRCDLAAIDSSLAPRLNSVLLVGPTASGKTHMVRSVERASAVKTFYVDVSSLTRTGWRGMSVGDALVEVERWQKAHPGKNCVIFWDEFDKVSGKDSEKVEYRSGGVLPNMLALFDGSDTFEGTASEDRVRVSVDLRRVCHILGGAFSGIDDIVEKRCGKRGTGFVVGSDATGLGSGIVSSDLVAYGIPVEIAGRICSVISVPALDEEALSRVLLDKETGVLCRYMRLFADGSHMDATDEATRLVCERVKALGIGARAIEQIVSPLFASSLAHTKPGVAVDVTLVVEDGELGLRVKELGGVFVTPSRVSESFETASDWFSDVTYVVSGSGLASVSSAHIGELRVACAYLARMFMHSDVAPKTVLENVIMVGAHELGVDVDATSPVATEAANVASMLMCCQNVDANVLVAMLAILSASDMDSFSFLSATCVVSVSAPLLSSYTHMVSYLSHVGSTDGVRLGTRMICRFVTRVAKHDADAYRALLSMCPYNMDFASHVVSFDEMLATDVCPVVKVKPSDIKVRWHVYDAGYIMLRVRPSDILNPGRVFESGLVTLRLAPAMLVHEVLIPVTQTNANILCSLTNAFCANAFDLVMVMTKRSGVFGRKDATIVTLKSTMSHVDVMRVTGDALSSRDFASTLSL